MKITVDVIESCLLHTATFGPGTIDRQRQLSNLNVAIDEQCEEMWKACKVDIIGKDFVIPGSADLGRTIEVELDLDQLLLLQSSYRSLAWPLTQGQVRDRLLGLDSRFADWIQQAQAERTWISLPEEARRKALKEQHS